MAAKETQAWDAVAEAAREVFRPARFEVFWTLMSGWVLAPGRRTICAMVAVADPEGRRAHDAYHRLVRVGAWSMTALWKSLVVPTVAALYPQGAVTLDVDDTLYKKSGRKINGAGTFRDAVRSTRNRIVYATGLNLVVVTLRVTPPWGRCPIGLPVGVRLHRKAGPTTTELAADIIAELAAWLPDRDFALCGDGAYASLAGAGLPRCSVTSRMRRDAALYEPAPPPTGKKGRPRTKGARLPTPQALSATIKEKAWRKTTIDCRGENIEALVCSQTVLWYGVNKQHQVLLVIIRDPNGVQPDDYFFTTDLEATAEWVAAHYAGRWSIEVVFRDAKQDLGAEDPQCWKHKGPERAAALSLWLMTAIWAWYIPTHGATHTWTTRPWYPAKTTPSFLDALAALRRTLWRQRITAMSSSPHDTQQILDSLIDLLATAA